MATKVVTVSLVSPVWDDNTTFSIDVYDDTELATTVTKMEEEGWSLIGTVVHGNNCSLIYRR